MRVAAELKRNEQGRKTGRELSLAFIPVIRYNEVVWLTMLKWGADMLTIFDRDQRCNRRAFLQVGGLGLGGLTLSDLLAVKARGEQESRPLVRDKSVIFLFLHGGPSQIETFDPKMTAPVEFRSATGERATTLPGVTFGGTFPRLASLANRVAVVRSFVTGDGNHDIKPIVGRDTFGA